MALLAGQSDRQSPPALGTNEDWLRLLLEQLPAVLWTTDRMLRFTSSNGAGLKSMGLQPNESVGISLFEFFRTHDLDFLPIRVHARALRGESGTYEMEWAGRAFQSHVEPLRDGDGSIIGAIGVAHDVTERREAERDLRQLSEALRVARDNALSATRAKGQFLANMSHEIRTPMNGILGMLCLLLETSLDDQQKDYALTASDCTESLLRVINDILDFSRIEAGRLELVAVPFDLRHTIEHVMDMLRPQAQQKGLQLLLSAEPDLLGYLRGDSARLRQVLTNLLSNALKFTDRGCVSLGVRTWTSADARVWARFEVQDTGIGIPLAAQPALFESFSQADASITRKYGGTGLGLAISRQLVEMMGGEIGFESRPGVGSTFWFQVPFASER